MLRARCVRVYLPRRKAGVCTGARRSALWWRLRVLCGWGGARVPAPVARGGGGAPAPAAERWWRFLRSVSSPPPPPASAPRAIALRAGFPLPLSCFGRASYSGKASCRRQGILHLQGILVLFASLPRGSGQWPSCRTLPHHVGAAHVELHLNVASPPKGSGQWNSCRRLLYCLGAVGS